MIKQVILDRDGTLIRHIPYLSSPEQVELLPGVLDGLNLLLQAGCVLFLHTNQSGIARGYFTLQDVRACNAEMLRQMAMGDLLFDDICISSEGPDFPAELDSYRKPSPRFGLELVEAGRAHIAEMCYLGDNFSDLMAAQNLGCLGVGVNTGEHDLRKMLFTHHLENKFPVFDNFLDAVNYLLNYKPAANET